MRRTGLATFLALLLAACTGAGTPSASAPEGSPTPEPSAPATPAESPEATPSPTESAPEGHPAAGLVIVRTVDPSNQDDPITQLFIIEADGSQRQVTGVSGDLTASFPVWSHDGGQLVFGGSKVGDTGIKGQVGLVNADGSGERELAEGERPAWSPDDTRIAFNEVDDVTAEPVTLSIVDVETGEVTDYGHGFGPQWLDEDRLLINAVTEHDGGFFTVDVYLLTLSTGERELIMEEAFPHPSPDRSMVLFEQDGVISVAPASDLADLTEIATGFSPVWSPDGTQVALGYDTNDQGVPVYAVVDLDGNRIQSEIAGVLPSWSPDGTRLAVETYREEGPAIHVIDVASGEVLHETVGQMPAWRPDPG
jgi:Tol biopolymer transport system component